MISNYHLIMVSLCINKCQIRTPVPYQFVSYQLYLQQQELISVKVLDAPSELLTGPKNMCNKILQLYKPFIPEFPKWMLPSLNVDIMGK